MRKDFREKKRKEGSRTEEGRVKEINWPEMLREGGGDRPASQYIRCHRNELIYCLIPNGWGHFTFGHYASLLSIKAVACLL